jgi:hypothetical protein
LQENPLVLNACLIAGKISARACNCPLGRQVNVSGLSARHAQDRLMGRRSTMTAQYRPATRQNHNERPGTTSAAMFFAAKGITPALIFIFFYL